MHSKIEIVNLFDLSHTLAAELFEEKQYPWEVLKEIKDFILKLGARLDSAMFDHPEEDIWIAKNAKIAPTANLNGPLIVDSGA